MICASCGAKIADRAIVCYKCGTPTAIPAAPPKPAPPRTIPWLWVFIAIVLALAAAGWLVLGR